MLLWGRGRILVVSVQSPQDGVFPLDLVRRGRDELARGLLA